MKVILTGATGYIGSQVLELLLSDPAIETVVTITRRPIPDTLLPPSSSSPRGDKLKQIIHADFSSWPTSRSALFTLYPDLEGADACVYALGIYSPWNMELEKKVNNEYALATARAFKTAFSASPSSSLPSPYGNETQAGSERSARNGFRFVYLSGGLTERDQNRTLWIFGKSRKVRGLLEIDLIATDNTAEYAKAEAGAKGQGEIGRPFEVYIARPGFVLKKGATLQLWIAGLLMGGIEVNVLAGALIQLATTDGRNETTQSLNERGRQKVIWENDDLAALGKQVVTD